MKRSIPTLAALSIALCYGLTSCDISVPYSILGYLKYNEGKEDQEAYLSNGCQVIEAAPADVEGATIFDPKSPKSGYPQGGAPLVTLLPPPSGSYPKTILFKARCYNNIKRDAEGKITGKTQTGETTFSVTFSSFHNPSVKRLIFSSSENLTEAQKAELKAKYNYTSTSGIWPVVTW